MPKRTKQLMTQSYQSRFHALGDAVLVDCLALNAEETMKFRSELRQAGVKVTVVKNSLCAQVFKDLGYEFSKTVWSGSTAIVFGEPDAVTTSKVINDWSKKHGNKITIKAGILEGSALEQEQAQGLTRMPSLPEIKQMLVSAVAGPLTAMVGVTNSILTGVPAVLQAISDKKKEEGE